MRIFVNPTQDTTLYQRYPTTNVGLDEILELGKLKKPLDGNNEYASSSCRIVMNFDIQSGSYPANAQYFLNLYTANAYDVARGQQIQVFPISQVWEEGTGYFYQLTENVQIQNGATWNKATSTLTWAQAGGAIASTPSASITLLDRPLTDLRINVSNILSPVNNGSNVTPWRGLAIKFPTADEQSAQIISNIKFFSNDTFTIFQPRLEVVWNDQQFTTGSLKPIVDNRIQILPKSIKEEYIKGEQDKIYLVVRDRYPDKRFDSVQRYNNIYYLPSSSYFRIVDELSDVELFRYDEYSAVNCNPTGSYINFDTTGLAANRYYRIELKIQTQSSVFFPDFSYKFKVKTDG